MLPSEIPIFPLPNVVLFPSALLPLHIFEPRYRAMVEDALDGERLIGMVMLQPGGSRTTTGAPRCIPSAAPASSPTPSGWPTAVQHHPARDPEVPHRRRAPRARGRPALSGRAHRIDQGSDGGRVARRFSEARQRLERLLARKLQKTTTIHPERRAGLRPRPCDRAAPRAARKAGAAGVQQPARAL